MREAFYEYYGLSDEEADKLWKKGLIVFDTNVILSLYRLSKEAREEILSVMNSYKSRIWLPQQVGYEYHEDRLDNALAPIEAVRILNEKVEKFENSIKSSYSTNPYIDYKKLDAALKRLKNKVANLSEEWLEDCPNMIREDGVLKSLTQLFEGKIGDGYEEDRLEEIYKLGNNRYNNKIPPGYKDTQKKNGDRHRFGDFIIWLQIIEQSKKEDKDIIFVTEDCKEDWWNTYKDDKLGPRRELIREFRKETGNHVIWFYTTERFLFYAKNKLGASVKSKTINEVKRPIIDLNSLMSSESGQVSTITIEGQQNSTTAESDSCGIGQISKITTPFTERIQFLSNQASPLKDSSVLVKLAKNATLKHGQTIIEPTSTILSAKVPEKLSICRNVNKKEPVDCDDRESKDEECIRE